MGSKPVDQSDDAGKDNPRKDSSHEARDTSTYGRDERDETTPTSTYGRDTYGSHGTDHGTDREADREARRRDEYGGTNVGAAFFGWLVAIGMTLILAGILGAIAAAVGSNLDVGLKQAKSSAESIGIGAGIALLVVLMVAYFTGGYVAGRMSRYDGGRQGVAVWLIGLLVTIIVVGVGALAGDQYNIFKRVNLPSLPIPTDSATIGGLIALAVILLGTLLAAFLGGKAGERYHRKIDRVGA